MAVLANLARMATPTTGTGTIMLGFAIDGHLTFAEAGITDGQVVSYAIEDGDESEVGRGVYTSSGTTLTRSVIKSTNSNNPINLSGAAEVLVSALAEDLSFVGARVKKAVDETGADYTSGGELIAWTAEVFDIGGWHDNASDNSRLTVPAGLGIKYVEFTGCVSTTGQTADRFHFIHLYKNGSLYLPLHSGVEGGFTSYGEVVTSGPIEVAAGNYFELLYATETDTSITVESAYSFFAVKVLGYG